MIREIKYATFTFSVGTGCHANKCFIFF